MRNRNVLFISRIMTLATLLWLIIIAVFVLDRGNREAAFPGTICFLASYGLAVYSLHWFDTTCEAAPDEIRAVPIWFTLSFWMVSMAINSTYILLRSAGLDAWFVIANVIVIAAYVVYKELTEHAVKRTAKSVTKVSQKTNMQRHVSMLIDTIFQYSFSNEARDSLRRIKEYADYGNMQEDETLRLITGLNEFKKMLEQGTDDEILQRKAKALTTREL